MRVAVLAAAICLSAVGLSAAADVRASINEPVNIPAQGLGPALKTLAKDRGFQVVFRSEVVGSARTEGASGNLSTPEALTELLKGTHLTYKYLDDKTVTIVSRDSSQAADSTRPDQAATDHASSDQGGGKQSSRDFRVAQVDQGTDGPQVGEDQIAEKKKQEGLTEILVTGSRLRPTAKEGAQNVHVYTQEEITQSGQSSISDFLNTLPSVSQASTAYNIATTVTLHGFSPGTTLVLVNGRRIESSGSSNYFSGYDFFDLNNIPLLAVERIEVVADGSSAVYGSDAIAGVVNIVLRKDFDGFEASVKHGIADEENETTAGASWGKHWSRGSVSVVATFQDRSALTTSDRSLTSSNDYTAFGGTDNNVPICHPGNVFSLDGGPLPGAPPGTTAGFAAVSGKVISGKPTASDFNFGALNECSLIAGSSLIPKTLQAGLFAQGSYSLTPFVELFTEIMYSHSEQTAVAIDQYIGGDVVPASNPYNPFGTDVLVFESLNSIPTSQRLNSDFFRPLVGARGSLPGGWQWELSAWQSMDWTANTLVNLITDNTAIENALASTNPATALNPFIAGAAGPQSLLQSFYSNGLVKFTGQSQSVTGFVRGSLFEGPAGPVQLVAGSEYDRDKLYTDAVDNNVDPLNTRSTFQRHSYAMFAEARMPIVGKLATQQDGDTLAATLAGRFDHYDDFGSKSTPQLGLELRPVSGLLLRGTYAQSFKAPSLSNLYLADIPSPQPVNDPVTGQTVSVPVLYGGNPKLKPITANSHTVGLVYNVTGIPNLQLAVTQWVINENNAIQSISPQFILDNPAAFPGRVTRDSSGAISGIDATSVNFGSVDAAGIDYDIRYRYSSTFGTWSASIAATQTYHYIDVLIPGSPAINAVSQAVDSAPWAPRWKGVGTLGWTGGAFAASIDGRYVGRYQDYDSTRAIGHFWLFDTNLHYDVGKSFGLSNEYLHGTYVEVGAVNLFNKLPQYSNFNSGFLGYDPTQADIRGRFLYAQFGMKW